MYVLDKGIVHEHLDYLLKTYNNDFEYMLKINCVYLASFELFKTTIFDLCI